jgi:hypothetical protein
MDILLSKNEEPSSDPISALAAVGNALRCIGRRATYRPSSRRAESAAEAGADPTVTACAIQSAPRSACYEALPLTLWPIVAQDSEKIVRLERTIQAGTDHAL